MEKAKVLIVDDAVFLRDMLKEFLSGDKFEVVGEAANGIEAVEQYNELRPDVTTMDITMPLRNGIEATREIVASDPRAAIIIIGQQGGEDKIREALAAGAADFLIKPFEKDDLVDKVTRLLDSRRRQ